MDIAILGSGSMASLFAAKLAPKNSVCLVGSWKEQITTIRASGLVLTDLSGRHQASPIEAAFYSEASGQYPLVLILVKGWQTGSAANVAGRLLAPEGLALTLQNGIGHQAIIADVVGKERAAAGVTSEGAMITKPGYVTHTGSGDTYIGLLEGAGDELKAISSLLNRAGFKTDIYEHIDSLVWGKLAVNSGINPLTALLQVPNGFLMRDETARELMCRAAEETANVAAALGIPLPYPDASARVSEVAQATAVNRSSMAQDIARGAPTEIEYINGKVVEFGSRVGIEVPVNLALLRLVRSLVQGGDWTQEIHELNLELRDKFQHLADLDKPNDSDSQD